MLMEMVHQVQPLKGMRWFSPVQGQHVLPEGESVVLGRALQHQANAASGWHISSIRKRAGFWPEGSVLAGSWKWLHLQPAAAKLK